MSMSPSTEGRRLKGFRLSDIPIEIRLRAADSVARSARLPDDKVDPEDRLFGRLLSDMRAGGETTEKETLRKVATKPSERVYWVSRQAWERVIG